MTNGLNMELKNIFLFSDVEFVSKPIPSDAFTAGCTCSRIFNLGMRSASNVLNIEYGRTQLLKIFRVLTSNWGGDSHIWKESVISSAHRTPFSMRLANSLFTNEIHLNFLAGSHFGDQNIIMERLDVTESFLLITFWDPLEVS